MRSATRPGTVVPAMIALTRHPGATRIWLVESVGTTSAISFLRELDCGPTSCSVGAAQKFAGANLSSLTVIANEPSANGRAVLVGWKGPLPAPGAKPPLAGTLLDLNGAIPSGTGWKLYSPVAIDTSGLIAGNGTLNSVERPFLLTPRH